MTEHVIDRAAWAKMDEFNQMGNIGSEVGRALNAKRAGKLERSQAAFYRGLDLIDLTASLWAVSNKAGLKELLYARELFAESIMTDIVDPTLEEYFLQFAVAARLRVK
ncbi:MAG: hypothetical protein ACHQUB_01935 [Candidatus Saccharimonadia bacterium]